MQSPTPTIYDSPAYRQAVDSTIRELQKLRRLGTLKIDREVLEGYSRHIARRFRGAHWQNVQRELRTALGVS